MLRWLAFCIVSGLVIFGSVYGLTKAFGPQEIADNLDTGKDTDLPRAKQTTQAPGGPASTIPAQAQPYVVVKDARFVSTVSREIPSERDGKLIVVGIEVPPGEEGKVPPGTFVPNVRISSLLVETNPADRNKYPPADLVEKNGKLYRRYHSYENSSDLEPGKVEIETQTKNFKELQDGDFVKAGQLVALVNPVLTVDEVGIRIHKLTVAEAERSSAEKTAAEYKTKWETQKGLIRSGATTSEQVRMEKLGYDRYVEEERAKKAAIGQTQRELSGAMTQMAMHEIRPQVSGRVKKVYRHTGEPAKNLEPVLKIEDTDRLRVEGLIEIQNARGVLPGMKVTIEPNRPVNPSLRLPGHLQEINSLAVGMIPGVGTGTGGVSVIASGSKDRSVRFWDASTGAQIAVFNGVGPRSITATSTEAARVLAAVGQEDGGVQIYEMKRNQEGRIVVEKLALTPDCHSKSVTCITFARDGMTLATGSDDLAIAYWKLGEDGKLTQISRKKETHRSQLTYLHFANKDHLVSAGRDNTLHVWEIGKDSLRQITNDELNGRSGDVTSPGVSPDGKLFIYDQGKELKIMSLSGQHLMGSIVNITGSSPFTGPALFSPEGTTIVTTCAGENRVELWRTPTGGRRATELRQFVWPGGQTTCAAFTPDSRYLVTGTQDHNILVWEMPEGAEIAQKDLTGTITYISNFLDGADRQVQIRADLDVANPGLVPGGKATIVIEPTRIGAPSLSQKPVPLSVGATDTVLNRPGSR